MKLIGNIYFKRIGPKTKSSSLVSGNPHDGSFLYIRKDNVFTIELCPCNRLPIHPFALTAFYSLERSEHITAEVTNQCRDNSFSSGCCFVEVEVDMPLGQVTVKDIVNVHDSGMLINPELAEAQVHGGMSMGLGYGLSEEFLYNDAGRPLNDNLLDYKIPTAMDTPDLHVKFIQLEDPTGPYGNKSLGEPPAIPVAPALRNAVLHATGVAMDTIPMTPQRLIEAFQAKGLI